MPSPLIRRRYTAAQARRRYLLSFVVVLGIATSALLFTSVLSAKNTGKLFISTDIAPVHSLVSMITGNTAQVDLLLRNGQSPHDAHLKPSDARNLQNADLVIHIGGNLSPQIDRQINSLVKTDKVITLFDVEKTHHIKDLTDHTDPHVWLDIENAKLWLQHITNVLKQLNPDELALYEKNNQMAQQSLTELSQLIASKLAPVAQVPFIVQHDAYGYFVNTYGLNNLGAITGSNGHHASAATLKSVQALSEQAVCVFADVGEPTAVIDVVNEQKQLSVGLLDPVGMRLDPGASLYSELLNTMADSFLQCLQ